MTRARGVGGGVGNLYENMAKQMAAFLDTGLLSQQSRHPKMVEVTLTNKTHVDILPGGGDTLLNLDTIRSVSNSIPITDMESHQGRGGKLLVSSPNQTLRESGWAPLVVVESLPSDASGGGAELLKRKLQVTDLENINGKNGETFWKPLDGRRD